MKLQGATSAHSVTHRAQHDAASGTHAPDQNGDASWQWVDNASEAIQRILLPWVAAGVAPGASAAFAQRRGDVWCYGVGAAGKLDVFGTETTRPDIWYDLASITKSVTALAVGRAVDDGCLEWDAPLVRYLPEVAHTFAASASIWQLLSHRAGLCAHVTLDPNDDSWTRSLADSRRPDLPAGPRPTPGTNHPALYSDLGYLLIGEVLQRVARRELDETLCQALPALFSGQLGSSRQLQQRGVTVADVAPTEVLPHRGGLVRGVVHDDNAWCLGETATCGHAGLFGTASGVLALGTFLLDALSWRSPRLTPRSLQALLGAHPDSTLRAGFDGKNPRGTSLVGELLGPRTFGHLGFTGTSYWCDPDTDTVVVLLTNRVCPSRSNPVIRNARPAIHDSLAHLARSLDAA